MPSPHDEREARLASLAERILAAEIQPAESVEDLAEQSRRAHQALVRGDLGGEPTELRVRLHGDGVIGHQVPADEAGAMLRQTQLAIRWIGARLRTLADERGFGDDRKSRPSIKDATRLYLQPQFGAGSLIFELVGNKPADEDRDQTPLVEVDRTTLLDDAIHKLLTLVASSEADRPEALGELSSEVARMGPRVASQLKKLAEQVTDTDIDLDLRWRGSTGATRKASLGRRGALAIKDAVERNRERDDEIVITGLLETVSTGKDKVRIETADKPFKMDVDEDLGITLGVLLHREVTARVARRVVWHDTGKATATYRLLSIDTETSEDREPPLPF